VRSSASPGSGKSVTASAWAHSQETAGIEGSIKLAAAIS